MTLRRVKNIILIATWFCFIGSRKSYCQKQFSLVASQYKTHKNYNLRGSELYIQSKNKDIFIPKINDSEFVSTMSIDSLLASDTLNDVYFTIRTSRYEFKIRITKDIYNVHKYFDISIFKEGKVNLYRINLGDAHGAGFVTNNMKIVPNKEWNKKFR